MPHIVKSTILDAPTDAVWDVLRDFNGHDRWHPAVATSTIERAQASDRIGCVRRFKLAGRLGVARAIAGAVRPRTDLQLLPARYADPDVQLCRPCPAAAGHRRRPHILALGVRGSPRGPGDAAAHHRHGRRRDLSGRASTRSASTCSEARMTAVGNTMPVTVKTFATSGEAAAALSSDRDARYLGGGTLVMRALNEGDVSISTIVRVDGPCARARSRAGGSRITIGAGVTLRAVLAERELAFLHPAARLDWRPGGAQHGHRRRQSVRARAVRRFRRRAARARRDGVACRAAMARATCRSRNFWRAATDRRARSSSRLLRAARQRRGVSLPQGRAHQAERRLCDHARRASPDQRRPRRRARASPMARWRRPPIRAKAAERALEGRTLDEASVAAAVAAAAEGTSPATDSIASAWYRREVVGVHLRRLLLGGPA